MYVLQYQHLLEIDCSASITALNTLSWLALGVDNPAQAALHILLVIYILQGSSAYTTDIAKLHCPVQH